MCFQNSYFRFLSKIKSVVSITGTDFHINKLYFDACFFSINKEFCIETIACFEIIMKIAQNSTDLYNIEY